MDRNLYKADSDKQLSKLLHELFVVKGMPDVEIKDPANGEFRVITRDEYFEAIKLQKMSPAKRLAEVKKQQRRNLMRLATALIVQDPVEIDADAGKMGFDAEGNEMDVEGLTFIGVKQYPKGVNVIDREFGAFVDDKFKRKPVRVKCLEGQSPPC